MADTQNDSGDLPADMEEPLSEADLQIDTAPDSAPAEEDRRPWTDELGDALRRPAGWGLVLLILFVLIVQIWFLFT